ncbi:phage tail assembly chaperone [Vermiculatibacterium agrestimuris]|uniref:phage tail assembly chaperone n=1 Tax=Vermiculatibacterium agrestimuris TaxID=2941519 RepID=UPI00203FEBEC|nr:hypothetical protein [Vermiculatibacterium agrestimuris]
MAEELMREKPEEAKPTLLELLLRPELPNVLKDLPTARFEIKRLSALTGSPVVFTLRGLPYGKVTSIQNGSGVDMNVHILLAGCVEPDWKSPELQKRFGGATPAETVKAALLPGEIEDLARAVERLSGYRKTTIEEIKNG